MYQINEKLAVASCDNFSELYPNLVEHLVKTGNSVKSRNGDSIEILNFKTIINNPEQNLVGGNGRNMNIFFLFAEAIWIWLGKRDVKFLKFFNSQMGEYSDDGINFHAPYGWRLRKWGNPSIPSYFDNDVEIEFKHSEISGDQIEEIVKMLSENPLDRRAVMSIWNPDFDLNVKSKDLPCNDMIMLKIRESKLHITIQNRSNDLHWGLPTNVFQFSFIGYLLSEILGVKRGTQVHNSQSLHVYLNNPLTLQILNDMNRNGKYDLYYSKLSITQKIKFTVQDPLGKLKEIDEVLESIYFVIENMIDKKKFDEQIKESTLEILKDNSEYLYTMFYGLFVYVKYALSERTNKDKEIALVELNEKLEYRDAETLMMKNFFLSRLNSEDCLNL